MSTHLNRHWGGTEHEISITPSEIEIYNPGEFLTNYTPLDYPSRHIHSVPRNKKLLDYQLEIVEKFFLKVKFELF